jgi:hypothetical protein
MIFKFSENWGASPDFFVRTHSMKRIFSVLVLAVVFASVSDAAGPVRIFGRRNTTTKTTSNNNANVGTAQRVANHLASVGRGVFHMGGNPYSYEGVGMGSTPDQALRNCCNNGGRVADSGVCQGSNGMWYACKRYYSR